MPTRTIASDWGYDEATINKWVRAATLFAPEHRHPEVSFSHYVMACGTTDPVGWIQQAVDAHWSTRDLRDHIQDQQAIDPAQAFQARVNAAIQRVLKVWEEADATTRQDMRRRLTFVEPSRRESESR